ncbi:MAG: thioredoxin [Bacteroidales bacterium]|nr:thioredoxin [Bacteroidales bacterium]
MKQKALKLIVFIVALLSMSTVYAQTTSSNKELVEVIYFHGKKRCVTCNAIEKLSQEVVNEQFSSQVADGTVVFKIVDITTKDGEALADHFEVAWSSLFVNKIEGRKEQVNDMTKFAFANALNKPEEFKKGLTEKINGLLNGK